MTQLTIAYVTARREPRIEWFFGSLTAQGGNGIPIVVVDYWHREPGRADYIASRCPGALHVPPKPSVWQGPGRRTSVDYWALANAKNTAICYCRTNWLAYADDLSVLSPTWLSAVRRGMTHSDRATAGAFIKAATMTVDRGIVQSWAPSTYLDCRAEAGKHGPVKIRGNGLFGCSSLVPLEAWLTINGWDEDLDSFGSEDCLAGLMIEKAGWAVWYDREMLTFEAQQEHSYLFRGTNKIAPPNQDPATPYHQFYAGKRDRAPNYFGPGGIRAMRQRILAGEPFPPAAEPTIDWRDGRPIAEM